MDPSERPETPLKMASNLLCFENRRGEYTIASFSFILHGDLRPLYALIKVGVITTKFSRPR